MHAMIANIVMTKSERKEKFLGSQNLPFPCTSFK